MAFIDNRFPTDISYGSTSVPTFSTNVVEIRSGYESRNQQWLNNRHYYDASYGVKTMDQLQSLISFFNEARGRLHGFRYKDWVDYTDDGIGEVIDVGGTLYLGKVYGTTNAYRRIISKPVNGTITCAGATINYSTGVVTGVAAGTAWTGEFDVPVRFDTDELSINIDNYLIGSTSVPLVEIRV